MPSQSSRLQNLHVSESDVIVRRAQAPPSDPTTAATTMRSTGPPTLHPAQDFPSAAQPPSPGRKVPRAGSAASQDDKLPSSTLQLRIRVAHLGQICRPWPRIQFPQQAVIPRLRLELRNPAVRIVNIAEHDRPRRTRLLARRLQLRIV